MDKRIEDGGKGMTYSVQAGDVRLRRATSALTPRTFAPVLRLPVSIIILGDVAWNDLIVSGAEDSTRGWMIQKFVTSDGRSLHTVDIKASESLEHSLDFRNRLPSMQISGTQVFRDIPSPDTSVTEEKGELTP